MWFVIWTSSSHEDSCIKLLNEHYSSYFERAFVPKRMISKKKGKEWITEEGALFPGYVFVDSDAERVEELASRLRNISGFNVVLSTDGDYLPLTPGESDFADRLYDEGGCFDVSVGIIEGDKIIVTGGPLIGMEGCIKKIDRHKRKAYLEIDMFGVKTKTTVSLEIVEKRA